MKNNFVLNNEIIQNKSLGGIPLRQTVKEFITLVGKNYILSQVKYELVNGYIAEYCMFQGKVTVAIDIRVGKVFKITASRGYEGKYQNKIS